MPPDDAMPVQPSAHALLARGVIRDHAHTRQIRHVWRATPHMVGVLPARRLVSRPDTSRGLLAALEHLAIARLIPATIPASARVHEALPILLRHLCGRPDAPYRPSEITVVTSASTPDLAADVLYITALGGLEAWPNYSPLVQDRLQLPLRAAFACWTRTPRPLANLPANTRITLGERDGRQITAAPAGTAAGAPTATPAGTATAVDAAVLAQLEQTLVLNELDYLQIAHPDDLIATVWGLPDLAWVIHPEAPLRAPRTHHS